MLSAYSNGIDTIPDHMSDKIQRFQTLITNAEAGDPESMFHLGRAYLVGAFVQKDSLKSFMWFKKAVDANYPPACTELSFFYSYGFPIDYVNAHKYIDAAVLLKDRRGTFLKGYMHYKGIGCTQDYSKAIDYFRKSIALGNDNGMYFLGLCYRNGYGITPNIDSARYWLKKAFERKNISAFDELQITTSEYNPNITTDINFIKAQEIAQHIQQSITQFNPVLSPSRFESGIYEGYVVKYDWSGEKILLVNQLKCIVSNPIDTVVKIQWIEGGQNADTLSFQGGYHNNKILLKDSYARIRTRYDVNNTPWWYQMKGITLRTDDNMSVYSGQIDIDNLFLMEKYNPVTVVLKKADIVNQTKQESFNNVITDHNFDFSVYPNPFNTEVNINYMLPKKGFIDLSIYSVDGKKVFSKEINDSVLGENNLKINLSVPSGLYIIELEFDKHVKTYKIQKL